MRNLILVVFGSLILAACSDSEKKPAASASEDELIETIRTLLDQQLWDDAISNAQSLVSQNPASADGFNMMGYAYLQKGDLAQADSSLAKAIALDTTDFRYYFNMGNTYNQIAVSSGEPRDFLFAHYNYSRAIELKGDIPELYINRAVMINNIQGFFEAVEDFKSALQLNDQLSQAHYLLGRAYRNLAAKDSIFIGTDRVGFDEATRARYRDSAKVSLRAAYNDGDGLPDAAFWLGMVAIEEGDQDMACIYWQEAKERGVENADINLHINCAEFTDEHGEQEVDEMIEAAKERVSGDEHFAGDGHNH